MTQILSKKLSMVPLVDIQPHPDNPNRGDVRVIKDTIDSIGFYGGLVVQKSTGYILVGNHRYYALRDLKTKKVPVIYVDVDDDRAKRIMLSDNKTARYADTAIEPLMRLLRELSDTEFGLDGTGYDMSEFEELEKSLQDDDMEAITDIIPPPAVPRTSAPREVPTDYYESPRGVHQEKEPEKFDMVATDPPEIEELIEEEPEEESESLAESEGVDTLPRRLKKEDVPTAYWMSDNAWDIPLLDPNLQAQEITPPFIIYGVNHKPRSCGTLGFYTDDHRFSGLWNNPQIAANLQPTSCFELNYTAMNDMPAAMVLWNIYRKRWVARYWQSLGIRIFVDLVLDSRFKDLNLLGVPRGWRSYCVRGYADLTGPDLLDEYWETATNHAGSDDIFFVVYAGGKRVKEYCLARKWEYIPDAISVVRGMDAPYGNDYGFVREGDDQVSDGDQYLRNRYDEDQVDDLVDYDDS